MGWALKTITKTRFTQKQNEFLKQQFEIGEQSGRKADPNEVSKMMRSSRDELGARQFLPEEVLTDSKSLDSSHDWQQRKGFLPVQ